MRYPLVKSDRATKRRYQYWLRRLGYILIAYTDVVLESEVPRYEVSEKVHRVRLLMERIDKWYRSEGIVPWYVPHT